MAADSFTNTTGTAISAHTAAGITWGGLANAEADGVITNNTCSGNDTDTFNVRARATNLTGDFAQIVIKGGAYAVPSKSIHVRAGVAAKGYQVQVAELTGDTITHLYLAKNDVFLTAANISGLSKSRLDDHTLAVRATTVAGGVELRAYIDGTQVTWDDTSASDASNSTVYTDLNSETPITSGNPGFSFLFEGTWNASTTAFDDFTDVEGGAVPTVTSVTPTNLRVNMVGADIEGTNFGAAQGGGAVLISPSDDVDDVNAVAQTVTSWAATAIEFNVVRGSLALATNLYLFVVTDGDTSNAAGSVVQILPSIGALALGAGLLLN